MISTKEDMACVVGSFRQLGQYLIWILHTHHEQGMHAKRRSVFYFSTKEEIYIISLAFVIITIHIFSLFLVDVFHKVS